MEMDDILLLNRRTSAGGCHVALLSELNDSPQQIENSSDINPCAHCRHDLDVYCDDNSKNDGGIFNRIQIMSFQEILAGREPCRNPGSASSWVNVQDGGADSTSVITLNNSDVLYITPDCGKGSCTCQHLVGSIISQLKPCGLGYWFVYDISAFSEADVYVFYGSYYGFPIFDVAQVEPYECANYSSITEGEGMWYYFFKMIKKWQKSH